MTKTTRVRSDNLYTIDEDGAPVAQAEAVSRSEAVALWEASKHRPAVSARLATPRESRDLAHLPLLTRGAQPERDPRVGDLFDAGPADPVLVATYCPPVDLPVKTHPPEVLAQIVADLEPDPLGLDAEAVAIMERLSDVPSSDHAEDALEMVPPTDAPPATADAPVWLDDAALTARKSDAFHAGLELGKRGLKRFSAEMLQADAEMLRGICMRSDSEAVHDELLRGFNEGKAAAGVPVDLPERRRLFPDPPKGAGKVEAKYRNPETGESWSGRGLKPRWLVMAGEAGKTPEDFLI